MAAGQRGELGHPRHDRAARAVAGEREVSE
jgi:hypothetical protein